jgi:predicted ATPase
MSRIILSGAGNSGKTTLKNELLQELLPLGWVSRDLSASHLKQELGFPLKNPTKDQINEYQRLAFQRVLSSDKFETTLNSVSERSAIDFLAWSISLNAECATDQLQQMKKEVNRGLYSQDHYYYLQPFNTFNHAYNRFDEPNLYSKTEEILLALLLELEIQFVTIANTSSVKGRLDLILHTL